MEYSIQTPVKDLLTIHNELAAKIDGKLPLKGWWKAKDKLIERIEEMAKEVPTTDDPVANGYGGSDPQEELPLELTGDTIRYTALELLCHVAFHEDRRERSCPENRSLTPSKHTRTVGLPYDEIIRRIKGRFPDCETTVACLRWYAVKVRAGEEGYEGWRLPQRRPRVKPRKK